MNKEDLLKHVRTFRSSVENACLIGLMSMEDHIDLPLAKGKGKLYYHIYHVNGIVPDPKYETNLWRICLSNMIDKISDKVYNSYVKQPEEEVTCYYGIVKNKIVILDFDLF
jgi:hypothetical protein